MTRLQVQKWRYGLHTFLISTVVSFMYLTLYSRVKSCRCALVCTRGGTDTVLKTRCLPYRELRPDHPPSPSCPFQARSVFTMVTEPCYNKLNKPGNTLSSRHVSSCDVTSAVGIFNIEFWRRLTLLSTLLTSRDLTWSSGRLTCQHEHASHISVVAHIS
jgi:hypothetical protein